MKATSPPEQTFQGDGASLSVDRWGLVLKRRWHRPRRIWWEELRAVEWLGHGHARLHLTEGTLALDEQRSGLRELVALCDDRAAEVRAGWRRHRSCDGERVARLCGLSGGQVLTLPTGSGWRRVGTLANAVVQWAAPWLLEWSLVLLLGVWQREVFDLAGTDLLVAATIVTVVARGLWRNRWGEEGPRAPGEWLWSLVQRGWQWLRRRGGSAEALDEALAAAPRQVQLAKVGLWLDGRQCAWERVREVTVQSTAGAAVALVSLRLERKVVSFGVQRWGARRALRAFRVLADLTSHGFTRAGDEPPPDNALSLARLTGDHEAKRGLSVTREEGH